MSRTETVLAALILCAVGALVWLAVAERGGPETAIGNAFEFVEDCAAENYQGAPSDGSPWRPGGACEQFTTRSYFFDSVGAGLRSAARCTAVARDSRSNALAIRVALSLDDAAWDRKR